MKFIKQINASEWKEIRVRTKISAVFWFLISVILFMIHVFVNGKVLSSTFIFVAFYYLWGMLISFGFAIHFVKKARIKNVSKH